MLDYRVVTENQNYLTGHKKVTAVVAVVGGWCWSRDWPHVKNLDHKLHYKNGYPMFLEEDEILRDKCLL